MPNETCMPVSREGTQSGLVGSCIGTAGPAVAVRNVRSRAAALLFERVYNQRRRGPSNGPSPMHLTLAPGPYADARCVSSCSCLSHPGNPPCNVTLCTQNTPLDILAMLQPSRMFALRTDARQVSLHGKSTCLHGMVMSTHLRRCSRHAVCTFPEDPVGFRCSRSWAQRDTLLTSLLLFLAPLFISLCSAAHAPPSCRAAWQARCCHGLTSTAWCSTLTLVPPGVNGTSWAATLAAWSSSVQR